MKKIINFLFLLCIATGVQAQTWIVQSHGPDGQMQESTWVVQKDSESNDLGYFLQNQDQPVYTLSKGEQGLEVRFSSGMIRSFGPGPLMVLDLPMPIVFIQDLNVQSPCCVLEFIGQDAFRTCYDIMLASELPVLDSLPLDQVVLVYEDQELVGVGGFGVRAVRQ